MAERPPPLRTPAASERRPAAAARVKPVPVAARSPAPAARSLQQSIGNRGTQALAARVVARSTAPAVAPTTGAGPSQLTVSEPGDAHEREADAMADRIMRMPEPSSQPSESSPAVSVSGAAVIQRGCAKCEEEPKGMRVQAKLTISEPGDVLENEAERVADTVMSMPSPVPQEPEVSATSGSVRAQRKAGTDSASPVRPSVESEVRALQGEGSPLPPAIRQFFETRFGADFGHVRVNTGERAQKTARSLGARAFTVGRSISFDAGQYAPTSHEGRRLLAHELTHVVQQDSGVARGKTGDASHVQPDWYNIPIPFTDYEIDPTPEGFKTAANLVADQAKEGAAWARDKAVAAAEWIVEKLESLINSGFEWLTEKFAEIKEFAVSSFADIKGTVSSVLGAITNPLGLIKNAVGMMDAGILSAAWHALTAGANTAWQAIKTAVSGVLQFGRGIRDTVSGFVDSLFGTVDDLLDSRAFEMLPAFIQTPIRGLYKRLRDLWISIRDFWTDFWQRLTSFVDALLASIEAFMRKVVSYAIDKVIETVKMLREAYDFIKRLVTDPEAVIKPIIASIAAKIDAEAPGKAREVAQQKMTEAWASRPSSTSAGVVVHRALNVNAPMRTTATRDQVNANVNRELAAQWAKLDIASMLWDTVKNLFYPPATIEAIGHEFFELWNTDWSNAADSLFAPRSMFDDFGGFWHDVWSNFLILLDFPLALWRRLNSILMLLMGYVTILLVLVGLVGGFIVGNVPGALAGAAAAAKLAWVIGEALFVSFLMAESVTALKAFLDLYTARQTEQEKQRDYVQIAASTIGIGVAMVVAILFTLLGALVRGIVGRIQGGPPRLPSAPPKQLPSGSEPPKTEPPAKEPVPEEPPKTEPPKSDVPGKLEGLTLEELIKEGEKKPRPKESKGQAAERVKEAKAEAKRRGYCFVAGTPIQTSEGPKKVESLTVGQMVLGMEEGAHCARNYAVTEVMRGVASTLYRVEVGETLKLCTTGSHPFFVVGRGWTRAKSVANGDRLLAPGGESVVVTSVARVRLAEPVVTFNLQVEEAHSYFVGDDPAVLVHNGTPVGDPVLTDPLIWGLGSAGPRQRMPRAADPSNPDPKLRDPIKGDLDGASGWRTGSTDEVGRMLGTRVAESTGNHGAVTEAQLKGQGLIAVNTPGEGALASEGFTHVSIRPASNPDPSVALTEAEMAEVKGKLESLQPVAQNKAADFLCV